MLTDKSLLEKVIESILFVLGQGIEINDIAEKLEVEKNEVEKAIENLKKTHENDGINIITYKNSVQMCSNPDFAEDIATVLNPIREKQLTKAALETAAIIAYKQPITKLEIEQVRGVNSDYAVQVLTTFKLIEVVGRKDAVGKPLLYGTTDEFLKRFDLQSIDDLPDYDELIERIKVIHQEEKPNDALYGSTEIIPEEELADSIAKQDKQKEENKLHDESAIDDNKNEAKELSDEELFKTLNNYESDNNDNISFDDSGDIIGGNDFADNLLYILK